MAGDVFRAYGRDRQHRDAASRPPRSDLHSPALGVSGDGYSVEFCHRLSRKGNVGDSEIFPQVGAR
jgi:hypothetical protein